MEKNVGGLDRNARLVAGPLLLVVGIVLVAGLVGSGGSVSLGAGVVLAIAGAVFGVTGAIQTCPLNALLGINTCPAN